MDETQRTFPDWIDEIAIESNGDIYGFEEGCWWDGERWIPIDDFDGLEYQLLGNIGQEVELHIVKQLHFRKVVQPEQGPNPPFDPSLPLAKD